ncbi:hypothetical protein J31TS4_08390 [Paenibacillus sp. J31TS4]|uniref:endonuclease Q family protein n=1 Tax=Paenibacillus sp. J31TS4 TaxID=2807195 RepID=UPI001B0D7A17|nr:endonuclease Q family protein [Paenibacillus sp. J31TS4]GIP37559.1 hypothetical protein J31TS4_08390 [Paenibacillus sp. J31TS4]
MNPYYADLHIHIGRTDNGTPVKISGARDLTFYNIAKEASERKGIDIVGIIDSHSPAVQADIVRCLDSGEMTELPGGGIRYHRTTIILGSEIEVRDPGMGPAHLLVYFRDLATMQAFTDWMRPYMKNVVLSSQRIRVPARVLQEEVLGRGGMVIPAHIFTPHRSIYGSCTRCMADLLDVDRLAAVELGLSSDTEMAGCLSELDRLPFVTNSDAHSLGKIAREYNRLQLAEPSYDELVQALAGQDGRGILANYGLNPRLGKYHRTFCAACESILDEEQLAVERCLYCGSHKIVRGVADRIREIADRDEPGAVSSRPPYYFQVPLEFIPGLGPRKREALLDRFGTEMAILHEAPLEQIAETAGEPVADEIGRARRGELGVVAGGGGQYGRIAPRKPNAD